MRTKFADTDHCPIILETTPRELEKLIELIEDAEGPYRQLRSDLKEAYEKALGDIQIDVKHGMAKIED